MESQSGRKVLLAGASGTIGHAAARALVEAGHAVACVLRDSASGREAAAALESWGCAVHFADLADGPALAAVFAEARPAAVMSCIASRSGSPRDARAVDYAANLALLEAAEDAGSADHFILLSAICVQRPRLAFQHEKLRFEARLAESPLAHTIVRPTAFFKSLSGQVRRVRAGKPFLVFGDGELTRCKPIGDADLGRFLALCVTDPDKRGRILPVGGPGPAISLREQGALLCELAGREPVFRSVPPGMFTAAARVLGLGAPFSEWFAEKAEYARIAHYYATESMLVFDPATGAYSAEATPEFGSETLRDHYARLLAADG
ncbi:NAD(P)H-binding protein [Erythrobacter sp. HL-111]|uniref:NAD(P)H-binding protein n=1 Tax=Erythrobacter sp. HL-111 TaxID=1798193 RepID=UPI0006DA5B05|nr:NAD(P)H-binding protein [Erythrobacter sp. HL-111]KPP91130.1 MAG: putative nucleoside-diphosphate-sugar epimerase [Erythrobacteraceae bacterium HL-111]SDS46817.1 divinylchlorophyllide 8-vinylreductase [Erythrobacter sp. HL-111]